MSFLKKLFQCFFCWRVNLPEWSGEAEATCACSFGRGDDSCNKIIATHLVKKYFEHKVRCCVQGEIAWYLDTDIRGYASAKSSDKHGIGYVGTWETVTEHVCFYFRPHGITKIHVEAHPAHAWRIVMCYRRFGMEVVSLCTKGKSYPSRSTQVWCRSAWRFIPYEICARLVYLWKGYL